MHTLQIKRVYDTPTKMDGYRILVDRLWPRGLTKEKAKIDLWLKEIAPSNELRKWYNHEPEKWSEFKKRYLHELKDKAEELAIIKEQLKSSIVTLLYSAHEQELNNAVVLKEFLTLNR